jgi:hypothetical protein
MAELEEEPHAAITALSSHAPTPPSQLQPPRLHAAIGAGTTSERKERGRGGGVEAREKMWCVGEEEMRRGPMR